ncbi:MAG: flagellar transcriptional regulator FlhD, partial [Parazoarcus communis]
MKRPDFQAEIRELNLAYLMLAQQMLRGDRETALFRLGLSKDVADFIE